MEEIRSIEQRPADDGSERPDHPSSAYYCWFERNDSHSLDGNVSNPSEHPLWRKGDFRPHHYFDYIVGTSTGG